MGWFAGWWWWRSRENPGLLTGQHLSSASPALTNSILLPQPRIGSFPPPPGEPGVKRLAPFRSLPLVSLAQRGCDQEQHRFVFSLGPPCSSPTSGSTLPISDLCLSHPGHENGTTSIHLCWEGVSALAPLGGGGWGGLFQRGSQAWPQPQELSSPPPPHFSRELPKPAQDRIMCTG